MSDESRDGKGRWKPGQSGNPTGRPRSGNITRQMLAEHEESITRTLIIEALMGNEKALALCVNRLLPALRPVSESVEIPRVATATSLRDKAAAVVDELASGNIGPDAARHILQAVAAVARTEEIEQLKAQVEELTALVKARGLI